MPSEYTYPYISGTGKAGTCHGVPLKPATPHTGVPMASATLKGHVSITSNSYSAVPTVQRSLKGSAEFPQPPRTSKVSRVVVRCFIYLLYPAISG